jgi:hypothetical protein
MKRGMGWGTQLQTSSQSWNYPRDCILHAANEACITRLVWIRSILAICSNPLLHSFLEIHHLRRLLIL